MGFLARVSGAFEDGIYVPSLCPQADPGAHSIHHYKKNVLPVQVSVPNGRTLSSNLNALVGHFLYTLGTSENPDTRINIAYKDPEDALEVHFQTRHNSILHIIPKDETGSGLPLEECTALNPPYDIFIEFSKGGYARIHHSENGDFFFEGTYFARGEQFFSLPVKIREQTVEEMFGDAETLRLAFLGSSGVAFDYPAIWPERKIISEWTNLRKTRFGYALKSELEEKIVDACNLLSSAPVSELPDLMASRILSAVLKEPGIQERNLFDRLRHDKYDCSCQLVSNGVVHAGIAALTEKGVLVFSEWGIHAPNRRIHVPDSKIKQPVSKEQLPLLSPA